MRINFAVIGTNKITDRFLAAAAEVEDFCLKGVYSRTMERAEVYGKKHGAEIYFDCLKELAACSQIHAVYIASPNCCHASQAIEMLKIGKHVLCEKPIASNLKEFTAMRNTAVEQKRVLMEAMRNVYSPGFAAIRENLPKLGTVRRASFQYCQYSSRYDNFKKGIIENAFRPELSNGALMDIGVYCVHPAVMLFGMPNQISSSAVRLSNGIDGAGTIVLEYDGMQAELLYSKITDSHVPSQIQGENASLVFDPLHNPCDITIFYRNGQKEKLDVPEKENNMNYELEEFLHLIREERYDHEYLENSALEMKVMDEVRRQLGIVFPADTQK